jgi:hypothetical protein
MTGRVQRVLRSMLIAGIAGGVVSQGRPATAGYIQTNLAANGPDYAPRFSSPSC